MGDQHPGRFGGSGFVRETPPPYSLWLVCSGPGQRNRQRARLRGCDPDVALCSCIAARGDGRCRMEWGPSEARPGHLSEIRVFCFHAKRETHALPDVGPGVHPRVRVGGRPLGAELQMRDGRRIVAGLCGGGARRGGGVAHRRGAQASKSQVIWSGASGAPRAPLTYRAEIARILASSACSSSSSLRSLATVAAIRSGVTSSGDTKREIIRPGAMNTTDALVPPGLTR